MSSELKFVIGYQLPDQYRFADLAAEYASCIDEVYFPWSGIPSGRGINIVRAEDQAQMEEELQEIRLSGIKLNLLWNANCYGNQAISMELEQLTKNSIRYLFEYIGLEVVTTSSLFVAGIIRTHFPSLEIRASVNMNIGSISGMKYIRDYFDSFYLQRELNRFPSAIRPLRKWCDANGKKLYLLANSGCLRNCSAHIFHDNLVAHEHEIIPQSNRWPDFRGVCWDYYANAANRYSFVSDSTWIRPEDLSIYDRLVDGIKLATRSHRDPAMVIDSYTQGRFTGNTLALCEPDFSVLAYLDNSSFPHCWMNRLEGLSETEQENYYKEIWNHVKC